MSSEAVLVAVPTSVTVEVGVGAQVGVLPLHRGHHAVWSSARYQADICNQVDDWVVRDLRTGLLYRFPLVAELMPWTRSLIAAMDDYDQVTKSPWRDHNATVRALLLDAAVLRIAGNPPQRNIFEPGLVSPAVVSDIDAAADRMLAEMIADNPGAIVEE